MNVVTGMSNRIFVCSFGCDHIICTLEIYTLYMYVGDLLCCGTGVCYTDAMEVMFCFRYMYNNLITIGSVHHFPICPEQAAKAKLMPAWIKSENCNGITSRGYDIK